MTNRTLIALAGALVIFSALALVGQQRQQPAETGDTLFLPGLQDELDAVERLELVGAGEEVIATLERGSTGWSVSERDGYPADLQKIRHTLLSLAEARILEAKTATPEWHDRLGVEAIESQNAGGVAVTLIGSDVPVEVIVGDSTGSSGAYVRKAEEAQSYLIDRDPEVGSSATEWLATDILSLLGNRIQQVTVTHPDGETLDILKQTSEQTDFTVEGIPEGRELQYESVANVMSNVLANLSLQDVESRTQGDEPVTITKFRTFDGLVLTVESIERGEDAWVAFEVDYEPPSQSAEPLGEENLTTENGPDPDSEARELAEQLAGWRYQIATYQFDQLTRRMSDLLRSLPDES